MLVAEEGLQVCRILPQKDSDTEPGYIDPPNTVLCLLPLRILSQGHPRSLQLLRFRREVADSPAHRRCSRRSHLGL